MTVVSEGAIAAPVRPALEQARDLPGAWIVLAVLTAVQLFNYMDRAVFLALVKPIQDDFALSDTQVGILTGFGFALVYATLGIPFGRLADSGYRRASVSISLAFWSVMTTLQGLARSFPQLLLGRMGVGIGEAGCIPACISLISAFFGPAARPLAFGIFAAGGMVGTVIGIDVGARVAERIGWRDTFCVFGLPGLLLALVAALMLREPKLAVEDSKPLMLATSLRKILRNRPYRWLLLAGALNTIMATGIVQWMQLFFMRTHGLRLGAAGSMFGLAYGLGMTFGMLLGGFLAKRLNRNGTVASTLRLPSSVSCGVMPAIWFALWLSDVRLALAATFVATLLGTMAVPASLAAGQGMFELRYRATAAAVFMLCNALIGIGLSSLVIGLASDALRPALGLQSLRYTLTAISFVNLFTALAFRKARLLIIDIEATIRPV